MKRILSANRSLLALVFVSVLLAAACLMSFTGVATAADSATVLQLYSSVPSATDWTDEEAIPLTASATTTSSGTFSMRAVVVSESETYLSFHWCISDNSISAQDLYFVSISNVTSGRSGKSNGKIGEWFRALSPDGGYPVDNGNGWSAPAYKVTQDGDAGTYEFNWKFNLGSDGVKGAKFNLVIGYVDSTGWADLNASSSFDLSYKATVEFGDFPAPPPVPNDPVTRHVTAEVMQSEPKVGSWGNETQYDMQKVFDNGESTGKISFRAAKTGANTSFLYVRWVVNDPSISNTDLYYVRVSNEDGSKKGHSNGKLGEWIRVFDSDEYSFSGAKGPNAATATVTHVTTGETGEAGSYEMIWKFGLGADVVVGDTVKVMVAYKDSEGWEDVNENSTYTLRYDAEVTFIQHYVTPHEATDDFTLTVTDVTFESFVASWNDMTSAKTYKLILYKKTAVDTIVDASGELYDSVLAFASLLSGYEDIYYGVSEDSDYAVQVVGYNDEGKAVCWSSVAYIQVPSAT